VTIDFVSGLPPGWSVARLDECVDVLDKARRPVNAAERAKRQGSVPYYGATGQVGWIDEPLFDEELLLLGEDGAPFLDKSKPIAYVIDGPSWVNNHAHVLRARPEVTSNRYLKFFLDSFDFSDRVGGSTRDKLTQRDMNAIPVLLAPPEQQRQIVRTLDGIGARRTSIADRLAAVRLIAVRLRAAVLAAACSGRLTADWRNGHGAVDSEPSQVPPASWEPIRLGDIARIATGATPLRKNAAYYAGGTIPWVTSGAVNAGIISEPTEMITPLALRETNVKLFPPGTLVIAMYGEGQTRGRVAELAIEAGTNQALAAVVFDDKSAPFRPYLRLFFENGYQRMRAEAIGGVQPNLSLGMFRDTVLPLPPLEEQRVIVERAASALAVCDRLRAAIVSAEASLGEASRAALRQAFSGNLVATGVEPIIAGDEPAKSGAEQSAVATA
jgi:type I restriction enzyme S subunit